MPMGTNNDYINCPKCETRNFNSDEFCGICGTELKKSKIAKSIEPNKPKKSYFLPVLLSLLVIFLLTRFISKDEKLNKEESKILETCNLISIETNTPIKFVAEFRLTRILSKEELRELALVLKNKYKIKSENIFLRFYLFDLKVGNAYWARADFKPDLEIEIFGQTVEDKKWVKNIKPNSELNVKINNVFGIWHDQGLGGQVLIRIRKDKRLGYILEYIDSPNSGPGVLPFELTLKKKSNQIIFIKKESETGDCFLIEENGNLSSYDKDGYITTYLKY
jgi:hypothetical protein